MENLSTMKRDGSLGAACGLLFATALAFFSEVQIKLLPLGIPFFMCVLIVQSVLVASLFMLIIGMCLYRCITHFFFQIGVLF